MELVMEIDHPVSTLIPRPSAVGAASKRSHTLVRMTYSKLWVSMSKASCKASMRISADSSYKSLSFKKLTKPTVRLRINCFVVSDHVLRA